MDDAVRKPVEITCTTCGHRLDVTGLTPFEIVVCPKCNEQIMVPMNVGNYRLVASIGGGGMGMVYKAVDLSLGRQVAVKLMRKDLAENPAFVETFTREARAAATLNHPNIATVFSFGLHEGQYYLVMELVPGGSLDDGIAQRRRIPEVEVLDIGMQVAAGLRHAFQRGLIHCDIKPGNILFSDTGIAKIVDFGLAEFHTEEKQTQQQDVWGTPYYIAPEKVAGEKEDFRSDMYSLGGTMFHALAGRAPFEANTSTDVVLKHLSTPALSLKTFAPDITDNTAHAVGRMLAKHRDARYASYDELIEALQAAKDNLLTRGVHRVSEDVKGKVQKSMLHAVFIIAGVVVGIAVCSYMLWNQRHLMFGNKPSTDGAWSMTNGVTGATGGTGKEQATVLPEAPPAPWKIPWQTANESLDQGMYPAALTQYQATLTNLPPNDPMRPWVESQIGLCQLLAYDTNAAMRAYAAMIPSNAPPLDANAPITTNQLVRLIGEVMTDRVPSKTLLARLDELSDWGQALVKLHLGVKSLSRGEILMAQKWLYEYGAMPQPSNPSWSWATAFQLRANNLGLECENFNKDFPALLEYRKQSDTEAVASTLQTLRNEVTYPVLVAKVQAVQDAVQKGINTAAAQQNLDEQGRQKELLKADMDWIAKIDASAPAYAANYMFAPLAAAYKNAVEKMQTDKGKQEATRRLLKYQGLADLKAFTITQINQKPYTGASLSTRSGGEVKGTLARADDDRLYFKLPYGELPMPWRNFAPSELMKLFQVYLNDSTDKDQKSKLEASLTIFRQELRAD